MDNKSDGRGGAYSSSYRSTLSAYRAGVSARNTLSPKRTATAPAARRDSISAALKSPPGPTSTAAERGLRALASARTSRTGRAGSFQGADQEQVVRQARGQEIGQPHRASYRGQPGDARLFRRIQRDSLPALPLLRELAGRQADHGALGKHRRHRSRAELGRFLDHDIHLLLAEDGLDQDQIGGRARALLSFEHSECRAAGFRGDHLGRAHAPLAVEDLHARPRRGAEDAEEMMGLVAVEKYFASGPVCGRNETAGVTTECRMTKP